MTNERILIDGALACVPFSIVVLTSFIMRPRLWLHSLPADIQELAPLKTDDERRTSVWVGLLVMLTFFGVPSLLTWRLHLEVAGGLSFRESLTHLYGVWMVVNLCDLVAIDWPYTYFVDPDQPPIAGTAGARGYKDYGFHFRMFLKASVLSLGIILPVALLIARLPTRT